VLKLKTFNYILREIKNLFEFYIIPMLAVVLPLKVYFPVYKFICSFTFFYNKYSEKSHAIAAKTINEMNSKSIWDRNVKLLYLIDIADFWLARFRPKKMLKSLCKSGDWQIEKGFMALSPHWGPGYITLLDLRRNKRDPYFVYSEPQIEFKYQSFIEKHYRRARTKNINKISGSEAITTGGGYRRIKKIISDGGVPIILFDAPQFHKKSLYSLNVFKKKYNLASGFINLICNENIDFQLYSVKMDFNTGIRKLEITRLKNFNSPGLLINELSFFFEKLLVSSPEQWFFWRQSDNLFEESVNA